MLWRVRQRCITAICVRQPVCLLLRVLRRRRRRGASIRNGSLFHLPVSPQAKQAGEEKRSWGDTPRQRAAPLATPLLLRLQKKPTVERRPPGPPGKGLRLLQPCFLVAAAWIAFARFLCGLFDRAAGLWFFAAPTPAHLVLIFLFLLLFLLKVLILVDRAEIHIGDIRILDWQIRHLVLGVFVGQVKGGFGFCEIPLCRDRLRDRMDNPFCQTVGSSASIADVLMVVSATGPASGCGFGRLDFGRFVVFRLGSSDDAAARRYIEPELRIIMGPLRIFFALFSCHSCYGFPR